MSTAAPLGHASRLPEGGSRSAEGRSWLRYGLAALAVSGLGLALAASVALTTHAESVGTAVNGSAAPQRAAARADLPAPQVSGGTTWDQTTATYEGRRPTVASPAVTHGGWFSAVTAQQTPLDATDDAVRKAVIKERAAQRSEDLSDAAEDATRLTRTASKQARANNLAATDRDIRQTAVNIATERHQRALAARIAAEVARVQAEAAAKAAAAAASADATNTTSTAPFDSSTSTSTSANTTGLASNGHGVAPVAGAVIGTPFGATGIWARYHTGLDFRAAQGTPVRAVVSGVVLYAGNSGDWAGNHVAILHANGVTTMSSHLSSIAVRVGDHVSTGQVIGRVGQTGRAFGPHLHFEVYPQGVKYGDIYHAVNPVGWLRANGVTTH